MSIAANFISAQIKDYGHQIPQDPVEKTLRYGRNRRVSFDPGVHSSNTRLHFPVSIGFMHYGFRCDSVTRFLYNPTLFYRIDRSGCMTDEDNMKCSLILIVFSYCLISNKAYLIETNITSCLYFLSHDIISKD